MRFRKTATAHMQPVGMSERETCLKLITTFAQSLSIKKIMKF
ncbi:hypothetical protein [Campylobacter concisus]